MSTQRAYRLVVDAFASIQALRRDLSQDWRLRRCLAAIGCLTAERLAEADPEEVANLQNVAARARNEFLEVTDALRALDVEIQRAKRRRKKPRANRGL